MLYYTISYYTTLYYNTFSKSYGPHVCGGFTSMLRMCSRDLLGNDLRRAVRDLICDENFDDGIATCLRLDFEIMVSLAHAMMILWLSVRYKWHWLLPALAILAVQWRGFSPCCVWSWPCKSPKMQNYPNNTNISQYSFPNSCDCPKKPNKPNISRLWLARLAAQGPELAIV